MQITINMAAEASTVPSLTTLKRGDIVAAKNDDGKWDLGTVKVKGSVRIVVETHDAEYEIKAKSAAKWLKAVDVSGLTSANLKKAMKKSYSTLELAAFEGHHKAPAKTKLVKPSPGSQVAAPKRGKVEIDTPKPKKSKKEIAEEILAYCMQGWGSDIRGSSQLFDWQTYVHNDQIHVSWTFTFRRNTATGAFHENKAGVIDCNRILTAIDEILGAQSRLQVKEARRRVTEEYVNDLDARRSAYGESAYSEYEQSFGDGVVYTVK